MSRKFKLYTTTTCPYCHAAVKLISENNMSYVPMVFEMTGGQEKFIGGYTDLKEYLDNGKQVLRG